MLSSSTWSLYLRFPNQNPVSTSTPYVLHAPPISFFFIWSLNMWSGVQIMKLAWYIRYTFTLNEKKTRFLRNDDVYLPGYMALHSTTRKT